MKKKVWLTKSLSKSFMFFLVVLLFFSFTMSSAVAASPKKVDENSSFEEIQAEMIKYISEDEEGKLFFDVDKAVEDGQSNFVIDTGKEFNILSDDIESKKDSQDKQQLRGVPIWGKWCGPGHGGGIPKDKLDTLCMAHDLCYKAKGYFNCGCDKTLVAGIAASIGFMKSAEKKAAMAVAAYFTLAPCKK